MDIAPRGSRVEPGPLWADRWTRGGGEGRTGIETAAFAGASGFQGRM